MSSTSSHVAPPKVTIASRPKTAVGSAHLKTNSAVLVPAPTVAFQQQQQPYEHGRRDNAPTSKLSNHPVPATSHTNTNLFAAPTRPPPPCVRPKSSSSASSTAATRRSVALAAAHSAMPSPRSRPLLSAGRAQDGNLEKARVTTATSPILPSSAANTTGNVYHAMAARKSAEDTATQLARRIAHFRAQEERVLREVQDVKSKLESALLVASTSEQRQHQQDEEGALWPVIGSPHHHPLQGWTENNCASSQSRREPKAPRSREQLQFLTKQKKVLQMRKLESAKHQKEKRKVRFGHTLALEKQKLKEEAEKHSKVVQKEKIRREYQRALSLRVTKQHELLESLEEKHEERLHVEKEREHRALSLIEQLREEEKHVALRLQALKFHQEFIKRGLSSE